jgi:hypothetical protein
VVGDGEVVGAVRSEVGAEPFELAVARREEFLREAREEVGRRVEANHD